MSLPALDWSVRTPSPSFRLIGAALLISLTVLFYVSSLFAATYYVDATAGQDTNNGLSEVTAWKTMAKVNVSHFQPGDQILFKRGALWREQLVVPSSGSASSPITFGAYGSGALPIITGADIVGSGWTQISGTVWQASVATEPKMVFFNGTIGANVSGVSSIVNANEWYWASNMLYIYSTSNPATAFTNPGVETAKRDYGIYSANGYITIQNIHTTHTNNEAGIRFDTGYASGDISGLTITGATSDYNYNCGIAVTAINHNISGVSITNNSVAYNGKRGIFIGGYLSNTVSSVNVQGNTSDHDAWTDRSPPTMVDAGIYLYLVSNATVQQNTISNTLTQNGLWLDTVGSNVIASNNTIYGCYNGGIIEDSTSVLAYYNVIYNCTHLGFQITRLVHSNGFYNNTVYGCATGIAVGWTDPSAGGVTGNLIKNNISWGNTVAAFSAQNGGQNDGTNGFGNVYSYNIFGPAATSFIRWGTSNYSTLAAWQTASRQSGNLASDPLFVSGATANFRLLPSSPAIKAGTNVGLTQDYAGNLVGTLPTIGAYEYGSPSAPTGLRIIP